MTRQGYIIMFVSACYEAVDAVADTYEQAQEIVNELTAQMYLAGERDFCYKIIACPIEDGKEGQK